MKRILKEISEAYQAFKSVPETFSNEIADYCLRNQQYRESIGDITDEEKLVILKKYLFVQTRNGKDNLNTRKAIECLTESIESEVRQRDSFFNQLSAFTNSLFLIAMLATVGSYFLTGTTCKQSNSQFCRDARSIPNVISNYLNDSN